MKIVIADDTKAIRKSLNIILRKNFEIFEAVDGEDAIRLCLEVKPDLLLTDIMMPKKNGHEVIEALRNEPSLSHTRFILISAIHSIQEKLHGYEIGAHDYITKPFNTSELMAKINVYSKLKHAHEVEDAFYYTISALARASEAADEDTGNHIVRVNEYSFEISRQLGLNDHFCDDIRKFAQMHDVGKVNVHPDILKKKGKLTEAEFHAIQAHPGYGAKIIGDAAPLKMAKEIALTHHEKWDGSGYPSGLKGLEIPISGRIVALGDVYDALRSERSYKPAFSHAKTLDILTNGDERLNPQENFDPDILNVFKKNHLVFSKIYEKIN